MFRTAKDLIQEFEEIKASKLEEAKNDVKDREKAILDRVDLKKTREEIEEIIKTASQEADSALHEKLEPLRKEVRNMIKDLEIMIDSRSQDPFVQKLLKEKAEAHHMACELDEDDDDDLGLDLEDDPDDDIDD
ncbi:hypothetical protein HOG17_01430 [Candidatus Peregrinibacteria bacterium]|nr:hypothetical protein [Candidatus Peregrinibacteria bacterium]MBT4148394.1 hypothetical protein [Candidatus Peregrinibacteria bacterium]MBT4365880.1 hypothetical protein [Candidatus Peregrinibacteria bacterium]MBT4456511.1 hypothetical protein [Candidatus Peregrinibacteria bacterium]